MKAWTGRVTNTVDGEATALVGGAPGTWVRLGRDLLVLADTHEDLAERAPQPAPFGRPVDVTDLGLVTQIGRLFQREHPDVPVVLDRGRYLVVDLAGRAPSAPHHGSWSLAPVPFGTAVFEERGQCSSRRPPGGRVKELVDRVDAEALRATVEHLASFPTRYSTSAAFAVAASWAQERLAAFGYVTRVDSVRVGGDTTQNVVADKSGDEAEPRRLIIVVAHLDSVNTIDGPTSPAPGADDNASGSAGLVEMASVLHDRAFAHDLRLILFGGEEQGLHGSRQYVAELSGTDQKRIAAVVNMDMVGCRSTPEPTVLIEGSARSRDLIEATAEAAGTYTSLSVQTSANPFNSDHVSFIDARIPAVLTIEGADSANNRVHTSEDDPEHVDYGLAAEIVRMNVATVATALGEVRGT